MSWSFKYDLFVQTDLVHTVLLQEFDEIKLSIHEDSDGMMILQNTDSFLYSKHPLTCLTKTEIKMISLKENFISLHIKGYPTQLVFYLIGGYLLLSGGLLTVAHTILGEGWAETLKSTASLLLMILGGEFVLYLLIKEAVRRYFDRLVDEIKGLTQ
jgi:hypothetical protein